MNRLVSLPLLVLVAACVTMPRTAEEFRQGFSAGTPWGGKTKVTIYAPGASNWSDALDSVFSWSEGGHRTCPKLP